MTSPSIPMPVPELDARPFSGTATWLEILPVLFDAGALWCLRPTGSESWRVPYEGGPVAGVVAERLAGAGLPADVVHSTSWRQERHAVLLTHLAVLPAGVGATPGFERCPVRRRELARGTATWAPLAIEVEQVVEHALRHLAWLHLEDPAIRAALEPGWRAALRGYRPEPFRVFEQGGPPA
jgi:hypothetical protein